MLHSNSLGPFSGQYYKHITIVNDDSSIDNKFEASLTDDSRVIFYYHHLFIVQDTDATKKMNIANDCLNVLP